MTTSLGLLGIGVGLVMLYGAWTNKRPDHLIMALANPEQTVGKID